MKKDSECHENTHCDNKFVWKDKVFGVAWKVAIFLVLGVWFTVFSIGQWKKEVDLNIITLNEQMSMTRIEITTLKQSIVSRLDTLIERTEKR
jgi:hypothetical protein